MSESPALLPLNQVNWDSDSCSCQVEVRRYVIGREPARLIRTPSGFQMSQEMIWCNLHRLDGSIEEIPMRVTTIKEMLESGLNRGYWEDSRRRQLNRIEQTENLIREIEAGQTPLERDDPLWIERMGVEAVANVPSPRDLEGWHGYLEAVRYGKTYADHEGYRRSPGSQTRGHLSHRCPRHHNQTSTSLMEQRRYKVCGCVIGEITVGERREEGVNHWRWYEICPMHRKKVLAA